MAKALAIAAAAVAAAAVCAIALSAGPSRREIHLVARDMAFYVDGNPDPNPVVRLRRGEEVRIVFQNADAGIRHDFSIPEWGIGTKLVTGGSDAAVIVRAPSRPSTGVYRCTPHAAMMSGTIAVE